MVDVSVVIATHNRASLVKQAIDSVLAQTVPVREVLVVDDGSTDDTREQLLEYGDRIRTFSIPQSGASAARNHGMGAAEGQWIAFLDDDDVWLPAKIERQMALVDRDPELGLVYCSDYAVDEQLKVLYERTAAPENCGDVFERLLLRNFIFTSCAIARREAIHKAGYMDLAFLFAQDWDLWLKIAAGYRIDFAPEPLVLYRQSISGCLTRDLKPIDKLTELQTIMERAMALRRVSPVVAHIARREMNARWAGVWLHQGRRFKALSYSMRVLAAQPWSAAGYRSMLHSALPAALVSRAKALMGRTR
jgi:glycosyltransferase involved in cell wall biosynthesis